MIDRTMNHYIDESGNRGAPFTDDDRSDLYALTEGLVNAAIERFPELLAYNVGSDGIGQYLTEDIGRLIVRLRREPRADEVAEVFGFEQDNVLSRRPCGRCNGWTGKAEVRGALGDFGVICERCMDELGLLDEYKFVLWSWDYSEAIQPWIDGKVESSDEYAAMMNDVFAELRRRYRDGERATESEWIECDHCGQVFINAERLAEHRSQSADAV